MGKNLLQKNKGFVLLFSVAVAAILLSIALGVANVAYKEIRFGSSSRDTNEALFAADTAFECALVHDRDASPFGSSPTINCNGNPVSVSGSSPEWSFTLTGLGSSGQNCAKVTVRKTQVGEDIFTTVISKGYNTGDSACASTAKSRVERELRLSY